MAKKAYRDFSRRYQRTDFFPGEEAVGDSTFSLGLGNLLKDIGAEAFGFLKGASKKAQAKPPYRSMEDMEEIENLYNQRMAENTYREMLEKEEDADLREELKEELKQQEMMIKELYDNTKKNQRMTENMYREMLEKEENAALREELKEYKEEFKQREMMIKELYDTTKKNQRMAENMHRGMLEKEEKAALREKFKEEFKQQEMMIKELIEEEKRRGRKEEISSNEELELSNMRGDISKARRYIEDKFRERGFKSTPIGKEAAARVLAYDEDPIESVKNAREYLAKRRHE